jgi:hypothetical protein
MVRFRGQSRKEGQFVSSTAVSSGSSCPCVLISARDWNSELLLQGPCRTDLVLRAVMGEKGEG